MLPEENAEPVPDVLLVLTTYGDATRPGGGGPGAEGSGLPPTNSLADFGGDDGMDPWLDGKMADLGCWRVGVVSVLVGGTNVA